MDSKKYIDLARSYVTLSNNHQLKLIAPMFAKEASYRSSYFGTFSGNKAISRIMVDFFSRFPDVFWQVPEYRHIGDKTVEFVFIMTGTDAATGEHVKRDGLEQIRFTVEDLVSHIAVRKPDG